MRGKIKLWRWMNGRQPNVQYWKWPIWYFRIGKWGFDAYILYYHQPTVLGWHRDDIPNAKHWRLNIKLYGKATFSMQDGKTLTVTDRRCNFFRSDLIPHSLEVKTPTKKLSFGFVKYS